jgi:N-acyl-D-amino-acid deacylase
LLARSDWLSILYLRNSKMKMLVHSVDPLKCVLQLGLIFLATVGPLFAVEESAQKLEVDDHATTDTVITGKEIPGLVNFDQLMRTTIEENRVPGGSLAITRNGKLIYARGFGYANREQREPVQPLSLFRIASITKPITATAVLQLVEQGRLRLDQKVFELLEIPAYIAPDIKPDARLGDITVLHCLQHTGGWDREKSEDPMFEPLKIARALNIDPPPGPRDIIRYVRGQPLDFSPGERFVYANVDYNILGRIIEELSGKSYEAYIHGHVLEPLNIRAMRLGHTLPELRAPGEVNYYARQKREPAVFAKLLDQVVPEQYGGFNLEAMDSHGAWLGSAVDLVRFAASFDDPSKSPLLKASTIETMWARPTGAAGLDKDGTPAAKFYGCGWVVRPEGVGGGSAVHSGALTGTSTLLIHRNDGINIAVLFNKRHTRSREELAPSLMPLLHKAADEVTNWPESALSPETAN